MAAMRPGHERSAGELRPLVDTHGVREASELARMFEQARDVLAADAMIHGDVHALAAEVVDDGQALDPSAAGERVHHEVQTPDLVDGPRLQQRHPFAPRSLDLATLAHRQVVLAVQPPHALVIDRVAFAGEQVVDAPVAEARAFMGELDDARAQLHGLGVGSRWFAIAGSGQPHKAAGLAFCGASI